jgi:transcriptional regulator with XRE-family HTH domain
MCDILRLEGGKDMAQVNPAIGRQLQEAASRLGISQNKLAKITGISRRHIIWAFQGGNVTVEKIALLMRALSITQLNVGDHAVMAAASDPIDVGTVLRVTEDIQARLDTFVEEVNRELAELRAVASSSSRQRSSAGKRAAQLVKEVTANARQAKSAATAGAIGTELADAVDRSEKIETPARRSRRR